MISSELREEGDKTARWPDVYFLLQQLTGAPVRNGNGDPAFAPAAIFPCAGDDQWIAIHVSTDDQWNALAAQVSADWCGDERFATNSGRLESRQEIDGLLGAWTRHHDKHELTEQLQQAGVAAGAVLGAMGHRAGRRPDRPAPQPADDRRAEGLTIGAAG